MPFIATWKYEPSCRSGMKKSAASRIVSNTAAIGVKPSGSTPDSAKTPDGESEPDTNRHIATPMPAAAPPYATASIAVSERSWICSTFMVITRNCSAFSSMTRAARSSASKVFSVSIPCRLSRNAAPISVYLPQYFLNTRAARIATMPTMSTMSGAQASSVAAVGRSIGASTANSVMGAEHGVAQLRQEQFEEALDLFNAFARGLHHAGGAHALRVGRAEREHLLNSFSRSASLTRSAASLPKRAAARMVTNRTTAAIRIMAMQGAVADGTGANSGCSIRTTATTKAMLATRPSHWQATFAAINRPTPSAKENSRLSKHHAPFSESFAIPPSAPSVSGIPTKGNDGTAIAENRRKNLEKPSELAKQMHNSKTTENQGNGEK